MKMLALPVGVTLCMLAGAAMAGSVSTDGFTSFTSGTAISSAEMNTNFNAVTGAVNGNADDISTMQGTISELQSTISDLQTSIDDLKGRMDLNDAYITLEELTDKVYCMVTANTMLTLDSVNSYARLNAMNNATTLTFTSASEISISNENSKEAELGWGTYGGGESQLLVYEDSSGTSTAAVTSFTSGVLSLDNGIELYVSKRGDMIIGREFTETIDTESNDAPQKNAGTIMMVQCR